MLKEMHTQYACTYLVEQGVNISALILYMLASATSDPSAASLLNDLTNNGAKILFALTANVATAPAAQQAIFEITRRHHSDAVQVLCRKENGWHFSAMNMR